MIEVRNIERVSDTIQKLIKLQEPIPTAFLPSVFTAMRDAMTAPSSLPVESIALVVPILPRTNPWITAAERTVHLLIPTAVVANHQELLDESRRSARIAALMWKRVNAQGQKEGQTLLQHAIDSLPSSSPDTQIRLGYFQKLINQLFQPIAMVAIAS